MNWLENIINLSCRPTDDEIAKALSRAFNIQVEQILIVTTPNWPSFDPDVHIIVCKVRELDLENFPIELILILTGDLPGELKNDFELFGIISEVLHCQLLTNPENTIEKHYVLFNGIGDFQEVYIREEGNRLVIFS